jgi:hypothetical protein
VVKPEGNTLLGRPSCRWEGNNKVVLKDIAWDRMVWIRFPEDRDNGELL